MGRWIGKVLSAPSGDFPFSMLSPALVILLFDDGHSHWCEVRFDVPFHGTWTHWAFVCVTLRHVCSYYLPVFNGLVGLH